MARITLNTTEAVVDGASFDPIPAGKHTVTVFAIDHKQSGPNSKKPGSPQINVQFKIADGHPHANRRVFKLINLFGDNPFDAIGFFKALDVPIEKDGNGGVAIDVDTDDLLGKELQITITHEEKKTKESGYTESFNPPEYREVVKGYRNLDSVGVSTTAKVNAGAKAGGKAGGKFVL